MNDVAEKIIFFDIETGGLHFESPIIELAAIAVEAGTYQEIDTIDMKIEFSTKDPHVSMEALGVNKFSAEVWEKWSILKEDAAIKFAHFLREHAAVAKRSSSGNEYTVAKLAGHNAQSFDSPLVLNWFKKHGPGNEKGKDPFFPALRLTLDTVQLADWFFWTNPSLPQPENLKLETLAEYFGLSQPDHSALNDTRATVELARIISHYQRVGVMPQAA